MKKPLLTPVEAAGVLGCDPHAIRLTARSNPGSLGFPVIVYGRQTRIPRLPFIKFLEAR